jgi:hypothetical protein
MCASQTELARAEEFPSPKAMRTLLWCCRGLISLACGPRHYAAVVCCFALSQLSDRHSPTILAAWVYRGLQAALKLGALAFLDPSLETSMNIGLPYWSR